MAEGLITLTLTARDPAHARRILDAVEAVDAAPAASEILVTRDGPAPTGHTYRELVEARRRGALDDTEGLRRLLRAALDALSLPLDTAAGAR